MLKYLEKEETANRTPNLTRMRSSQEELKKRFKSDENDRYLVATLLGLRFKTSFLGLVQAERAREALKMSQVVLMMIHLHFVRKETTTKLIKTKWKYTTVFGTVLWKSLQIYQNLTQMT